MNHIACAILFHFLTNVVSAQSIERVYPFQKDGKFGLVNGQHMIKTSATFDYIELFPLGYENPYTIFGKKQKDGVLLYGIIDTKAKEIIKPNYANLEYNGNQRYAVYKVSSDSLVLLNIPKKKAVYQGKYLDYQGKSGLFFVKRYQKGTTNVEYQIFFENQTSKTLNGGEVSYIFNYDNEVEKDKNLYRHYVNGLSTYYNGLGEVVVYNDMFGIHDEAVFASSNNKERYEQIMTRLKKKYPVGTITPMKQGNNEIGDLYILKKANGGYSILGDQGDVRVDLPNATEIKQLEYQGHYIPILVYKENGYFGALNEYGRKMIEPIFDSITAGDKSTYLKVAHRSGYSGFAFGDGKILLPRECGCIN